MKKKRDTPENTVQKPAHSGLEQQSLRSLLHLESTYIWKWYKNTGQVEVDDLFYQKLCVAHQEKNLAGNLHNILHPEDKIPWLRFIANLQQLNSIDNLDVRFRHENGHYLWFRITIENDNESNLRMGLLRDITKDKEQQALTQHRNARLKASIQNTFGLNIIIDKALNIKHIHNAGIVLREIPDETIRQITIDSIFDKNSRKTFLNSYYQTLKNYGQETRAQVKTNPVYTRSQKYLEIVIINKLDDPVIQGLIIDARDITSHKIMEYELKKQTDEYLKLSEEYEAQNRKIRIKNEILESKNQEIAEANEKLLKSEKRFLSLSRIVNEAITILENNKKVYVSQRLAQITGYPLEELYNIDINHFAAPGENTDYYDIDDSDHQIKALSFWGYTKTGEKKYFSNIFYTEQNPGEPAYTFIVTTDKTKEKIQKQLLNDNQMKLKATLESLQKWIIVVDNQGYILNYYRPTSASYLLINDENDPTGKHYTELALPDSFIEKVLEVGVEVQQSGRAQSTEIPLKVEGRFKWFYINISIRYNTTGQNIGWTLVMDDITRIKSTEMELEKRENQLFSLINHFPDIVGLKDNENRWILANKPLLELYGLKNQPYLLKTSKELAIKYPEYKNIFNKCSETDALAWHNKEQIKYDMVFDLPNNRPKAYEVIKVPIFDDEENPNWLIMLGRDVTERNQMIQELEEAKETAEQADQLKTTFLTNMSHELRTPLNGIVGFSQLLRNAAPAPEEQEEFLEIIYESSHLLLNIINDIIDLSKMETGQITINIKPVNIKELVKESMNYYEKHFQRPDINFSYQFPEHPKEIIIDTDKVRLQQILNNLVSNAFKFTKQGSIIIAIDFDIHHEHLIISVSDSGIGINKKYHDTIFERFRQVEEGYTREFGGTGLGLAITKKLVGMLGGSIKLRSTEGKGTVFSVYLPYISMPDERAEKERPPDISFIQNKTVLAVEDDAGSYLLLKSILRNTGCHLYHVKNGKEAIDFIYNQSEIDLVLMDVQMPVMDGLEATRKIKAIDRKIPVIAQTAHAFTNDREQCHEAGCDDYITKPIKFNELFRAMYKTIVK